MYVECHFKGESNGKVQQDHGKRGRIDGSSSRLGFDGILSFVEPTNAGFDTLNVYGLFEEILSASAAAGNAIDSVQNFFPYPISRAALGFRLPAGLEAMVDFSIFPQFLTNTAVGAANKWGGLTLSDVQLNALHVGSRVRKVLLQDAPGIPAISVGAGYSYSGFNIGYDFGQIDPVETVIGFLHFAGELYLQNRIHSFGLDLQVSKNLGFFVPFVGISPYYQLSSFSGGVGTTESPFVAFVDYDGVGEDHDIDYNGDDPATALVDNDLSFLVFGGFDLVFGRLAMEVHAAYNVGEAWPAVTIGTRWQ